MRFGLVLALVLALAACGDDAPVCGNGRAELGEQCDDGNHVEHDGCTSACRTAPTLDAVVEWTLLADVAPGFTSESCNGVQAQTIHLELAGPVPRSVDVGCSYYSYPFRGLLAGDYPLTAQLFDVGGAAVSSGATMTSFNIGGSSVDVALNFDYADFLNSYVGTFFFTVSWGGNATCGPVAAEVLTLLRGGVPLAGETGDGCAIDGSASCACFPASDAQSIAGLTWGPAEIRVDGLAADGTTLSSGAFATFIGGGLSNPWIELDVPSVIPDAGPADAPPDAGVVDAAGTPDT